MKVKESAQYTDALRLAAGLSLDDLHFLPKINYTGKRPLPVSFKSEKDTVGKQQRIENYVPVISNNDVLQSTEVVPVTQTAAANQLGKLSMDSRGVESGTLRVLAEEDSTQHHVETESSPPQQDIGTSTTDIRAVKRGKNRTNLETDQNLENDAVAVKVPPLIGSVLAGDPTPPEKTTTVDHSERVASDIMTAPPGRDLEIQNEVRSRSLEFMKMSSTRKSGLRRAQSRQTDQVEREDWHGDEEVESNTQDGDRKQ